MGKRRGFKIGDRAESDHLEIALRKRRGGKKQRRKGMGDRNVVVDFFWNCCFMFKENVIRNQKARSRWAK
jgi:hypothetical protein